MSGSRRSMNGPGLTHPHGLARLLAHIFARLPKALPQTRHEGSAEHPVKRAVLLAVACLGGLMPVINLSMVSSAYLSLSADFNADLIDFSCLAFGNLMLTGLAAPLTTPVHAMLGLRRAVLSALFGMIFGNFQTATSTSLVEMCLWFTLSGLSGGFLLSLSARILTVIIRPEERLKKLAFWALFIGIGSNFAPLVAGWLVEFFAWHGIFYLVPLVAAPSFVIAYFWLPESRIPRPPFDGLGLLFILVTMGSAVLVAAYGQTWGWDSNRVLTLLFAAASGFLLLVVRCLTAKHPLLHLKAFGHRGVLWGILCATLLTVSHVGARIETLLFCRYIMKWNPAAIANLFLVPFLGFVLTVFPAGWWTAHRGMSKILTAAAFLLLALSAANLTAMHAATSPVTMSLWLTVGHCGYALGIVAMTPLITRNIPGDVRLAALPAVTTSRFAGVALSMSLLTPLNVILRADYGADLSSHVAATSPAWGTTLETLGQIGMTESATLAWAGARIAERAMIYAFDTMYWGLSVAAAVGFVVLLSQRKAPWRELPGEVRGWIAAAREAAGSRRSRGSPKDAPAS